MKRLFVERSRELDRRWWGPVDWIRLPLPSGRPGRGQQSTRTFIWAHQWAKRSNSTGDVGWELCQLVYQAHESQQVSQVGWLGKVRNSQNLFRVCSDAITGKLVAAEANLRCGHLGWSRVLCTRLGWLGWQDRGVRVILVVEKDVVNHLDTLQNSLKHEVTSSIKGVSCGCETHRDWKVAETAIGSDEGR